MHISVLYVKPFFLFILAVLRAQEESSQREGCVMPVQRRCAPFA